MKHPFFLSDLRSGTRMNRPESCVVSVGGFAAWAPGATLWDMPVYAGRCCGDHSSFLFVLMFFLMFFWCFFGWLDRALIEDIVSDVGWLDGVKIFVSHDVFGVNNCWNFVNLVDAQAAQGHDFYVLIPCVSVTASFSQDLAETHHSSHEPACRCAHWQKGRCGCLSCSSALHGWRQVPRPSGDFRRSQGREVGCAPGETLWGSKCRHRKCMMVQTVACGCSSFTYFWY